MYLYVISRIFFEKEWTSILRPSTFLTNAPIVVIDASKQNDTPTVDVRLETSENLTNVSGYCSLIFMIVMCSYNY